MPDGGILIQAISCPESHVKEMTQSSLFPTVYDRNKPPPATADADCVAINSGTQKRYLCKSTRRHAMLPAIEWICASLARSCEIAVPDWEIVQLKGADEKMFGSTVDFTMAEESFTAKKYEAQAKCLVLKAALEICGADTQRYVIVAGGGNKLATAAINLLEANAQIFDFGSSVDMQKYLAIIQTAAHGFAPLH